MVWCLVEEFGADANQSANDGSTALFIAAQEGHGAIVRCLAEESGANVNDGRTPLMAASHGKHKMVAKYLIKHDANPQAFASRFDTAAIISRNMGAPAHLTAFLGAKAYCAKPFCAGTGLRKCTGCKRARYCSQQCHVAHWPSHMAECKQRAGQKAGKEK
jgi:hypothetical protein